MPPKRKLRFFEELIPKDARKQRIENIIPVGNRHFPVVYPESNLVCGLCGAGPFTIGSMSKHMNSIGEGCKEAPTKFYVPSSTDKSVVKELFKLPEKKVQEEDKENATPASTVFRAEPEKKEKEKVEKRLNQAKKVGIGRKIQIRNTCFLCSQRLKLKGPNFTPCVSCKNNTSQD